MSSSRLKLLLICFLFLTQTVQSQEPISSPVAPPPPPLQKLKLAWSLVIIPTDETILNPEWIKIIENSSDLRINMVFCGNDFDRLTPVKKQILDLKNSGRLEIVSRIDGDPILPIIYDTQALRTYLPRHIQLPPNSDSYPLDVMSQIIRAKLDYKKFTNDIPKGFVPGGGSISLPVAEFLNKNKFSWAVGGFREKDWSPGAISRLANESGKSIAIFAADPLSNSLHSQDIALDLSAISSNQLVETLLLGIQDANKDERIPVVVFDEAYSIIPLNNFLNECAKQMRSFKKVQMRLGNELEQQERKFFSPVSVQIWPYSWHWIQGLGKPKGPGLTAWIGDTQKNLIWDLVWKARKTIDTYKNSGKANVNQLDALLNQLYAAQSSDIFEWIGNETSPLAAYYAPYQNQKLRELKKILTSIYKELKMAPPLALETLAKSTVNPDEPSMEIRPSDTLKKETSPNSVSWSYSEIPKKNAFQFTSFSVTIDKVSDTAEMLEFSFTLDSLPPVDIDLYVDINHRENAGNNTLLAGRNAETDSKSGWEYLLQIDSDHVLKIIQNTGQEIYRVFLNGLLNSNIIKFRVPKELLGKNPLQWGYLPCIIKDEKIADFMAPVEDKNKAVTDLSESKQKIILPMLYQNN